MEGADIYQIAKNCRTSVEMIEKYYAAHIETSLDAAAINVMRAQEKQEKQESDRFAKAIVVASRQVVISLACYCSLAYSALAC